MAFAPAHSLLTPLSRPMKPTEIAFPVLPLARPKCSRCLLSSASSSNRPSSFSSEQAVLEAVADLSDSETFLPAVRTYENDLTRLTVAGSVDFHQALRAAAADGGDAADEHISSGMSAMVVETVFPGHTDDHSTVSTRLFLPTMKVKEKAIRLKRSLTKDVFQGTPSKNILAMTFRQVVLEQLWSFELALLGLEVREIWKILRTGESDEFSDSICYQQVPLLALSSPDERTISEIGQVMCIAALENTERHLLHDSASRASSRFLSWFHKRKHISSKDSAVGLYNLVEHEILANSKMLLDKFKLEKAKHKLKGARLKGSWLTSPAFSKLEKIGGSEFCAWISECVPSYMLEIDATKLSDAKFEGWKKSEANTWQVVLTHSQMVSLVDILDMYYEDTFTLPNKRLPCNVVAKSPNLDLNKDSSLLKMLSTILLSGILFVAIGVLGKLYLPHLPVRKKYIQKNSQASSSEICCVSPSTVVPSELEMCCISIIRRIRDSFGWPGDIRTKSGVCAWIGILPKFLSKLSIDDTDFNMLEISSTSLPLVASEEEMKSLEDTASYQVVVSTEWKTVGFQPTNRVAVNNWAVNPLARELNSGRKLSPGLLEPGLRISNPSGVVILELLMSLNPDSYFALVRAVDTSPKIDG